jgi:phosphatidate cytidylyltransferase
MPLSRTRLIGAPLLLAALGSLLAWGHSFEKAGRPNHPLGGLLLVVGVVVLHELAGMARAKSVAFATWTASAAWAFLVAARMGWIPAGPFRIEGSLWLFATTALALALLCGMVFRYGKLTPDGAGMTLLGFAYVSLLGFLFSAPAGGPLLWHLVFLVAAGKGSDMAAYSAGKLFGKHRMTPVVSPNKTWEGGIAGAIVGTAAGFAVLRASPAAPAFAGVAALPLIVFALFVTIAAQLGDLVKSALKRWAGVKDSGRLLPEFGGMLDMVDSFLLAAPAAHLGAALLAQLCPMGG